MLFKKSVFFLLNSFFGISYSAESPVEECFRIEIEDSAMWGQVFAHKSEEKRVLVVLHCLDKDMSVLRQPIHPNERIMDVYFWEQIPREFEENAGREVFVTKHLKGYFYPSDSKLVIFPRVSMFYTKGGGIAVVEDECPDYASFPSLINQALISILKQNFFYKRIVYFGERALLRYLERDAIHRALDGIYKKEDSPVQEFTSRVLGSPPRPTPTTSRQSSPASERVSMSPLLAGILPDRLGGMRRRLELLRTRERDVSLSNTVNNF